jgi:hypothetical protein
MKIAIICEGKTEKTFKESLDQFLKQHLSGNMPALRFLPYHGRIPTNSKLKRLVENLLKDGNDHVIALTDVYTGTQPPEFENAQDAIDKMRQWVGDNPQFHPHAAQHDFEAWLLPFWPTIQKIAGHNKCAPSGKPETVNHNNPPAYRIGEIFRIGKSGRSYVKTRDAKKILKGQDLLVSANQCPTLKSFINTILSICGRKIIP